MSESFIAGDDIEITLSLFDGDSPIALEDVSEIVWVLKTSTLLSSTPIIEKKLSEDEITLVEGKGIIRIELSSSETINLYGTYYYYAKITTSANKYITLKGENGTIPTLNWARQLI